MPTATKKLPENLVQDLRLIWDCSHLKQIDEAKAEYMFYRNLNYLITKASGEPIERFDPKAEELIIHSKIVEAPHQMKILCEKGDERLTWDKDNGKEGIEAKHKFEDLIKKGYKAYSVDRRGRKNRRIKEFDVEAEEILMIPPTSKG